MREHALEVVDALLLDWEESELVKTLLETDKGVIYEPRVDQIKLIALHLEVQLTFNLSKPQRSRLVQVDLIKIDSNLSISDLIEHTMQTLKAFLVIQRLPNMPIVRVAHLVMQFTPLPLNHLLHEVEIGIELLQKEVSLPSEDLLETCEIRDCSLNLLALLHDLVFQSVLLLLSLVHHLT